ncbi:DNA polymerase III subunit beta [Dactylosporangium sucinum]|uniref:DNA polymerase III subunit beta n=1 Tax=Dactylosporangium sucinum TaxID=1424081 RepID=A0A917UBT9_9ACTN|nr:DNA polymerase III subunit beta [Dactylosporangium sucinum]
MDAGALADAATLANRLLTGRSPQPVHGAVRLHATGPALELSATDGTLTLRLTVPATVREPGEAVVPRRALAETLAGLSAPTARLAVEGRRLAVRVPSARFALPLLADPWPPLPALPPPAATLPAADLRSTVAAVAGAASRDDALPIFTGVRLRTTEAGLSLLATDRYRMAAATLPWPSTTPLETLVPATVLTRAASAPSRADEVTLHASPDLFAVSWPAGSLLTPTLGMTYPDAQFDRLLSTTPECVAELEADALAAAADRAARYAGPHGRVTLHVIDGAVLVQASDPLHGESEETLKATVHYGQGTRHYQARLLADAARAFAHAPVHVRIQESNRATELTSPATTLRYLVVPMRPTEAT